MIAVDADRAEHDAGQFCLAWPHPSLIEAGRAQQGGREGEGAAALALFRRHVSRDGMAWHEKNIVFL